MDSADVATIDKDCYYEFGPVTHLTVRSGSVIVDKGGIVYHVDTLGDTDGTNYVAALSKQNGGIIMSDPSSTTIEKADTETIVPTYTASTTAELNDYGYEISSLSDLKAFRDIVNNGFSFAGITVNLKADIDISGEGWKPIGNTETPFIGTFNGNGHTIKGFTNSGYNFPNNQTGTTASAGNFGGSYGFFGVVGSKTENSTEKVVIKSLKFDNVNIEISNSNNLGVLIGSDVAAAKITKSGDSKSSYVNASYSGDIDISSISVSGKIYSKNTSGATMGGIIGKLYTIGTPTITSCTTNLEMKFDGVTNNQQKIGGILGYAANCKEVNLNNCTTSGSINMNGTQTKTGDGNANIGIGTICGGANNNNSKDNTKAEAYGYYIIGCSSTITIGEIATKDVTTIAKNGVTGWTYASSTNTDPANGDTNNSFAAPKLSK